MFKQQINQRGFSLIELIIVVGIIALLASIVVASLTDAREGARNNKRNELARQYVNALGIFNTEFNKFPDPDNDSTSFYCLGTGYPDGECRVYDVHSENPNINGDIDDFIPAPPSLESFTYNGDAYFGMAYKCLDADCSGYSLDWLLEGGGSDAECFGGATAVNFGGSFTYCTFRAQN